jgi:hypothetical protein
MDMKKPCFALPIVAFCAAVTLTACSAQAAAPSPAPQPTAAPTATSALPAPVPKPVVASGVGEDVLKNGQYELPEAGKVQLSDGKFAQQTGEGATQANQVFYVQSARGDLNGDGVEDAVVILALNTGGSGTFMYLVPVVMVQGTAQQYGADLLGDRTRIETLAIADGQIALSMASFGPKDPMCCPSQKADRIYVVRTGSLVLLGETVVPPTPTPQG